MKRLGIAILVESSAIFILLSLLSIYTFLHFAADLSPKEVLVNHSDTGIKLLDSEGKLFFTFYDAKYKRHVSLSEIPLLTQKAIIAIEDKDFYSHPGFSTKAIVRSSLENIKAGKLAYGGSTITQQLVKNTLLVPRKYFLRKLQEIVLAAAIETKYSKPEILEMYLNTVYFGENSFGVEDASYTYFNKPAKDLNLAQSSMLAAILPIPSKLSLFNGSFKEAKARQKLVLEKMVIQGFITEQQKEEALQQDLGLTQSISDINTVAPHFAIMVRDQLIEKYGQDFVANSGFKVKTTLNLEWQKYAEKSVAAQVDKLKINKASNGAAVVIDPKTFEVKALVGSLDWENTRFGKVNMAISPRSPGSAFKPIVYVRAFEKGLITPVTLLRDEPTRFANFNEDKFFASFPSRAKAEAVLSRDPNAYYSPKDYDGKFRGVVTVRRALANSLNIPSVAVLKKVGLEEALSSARNLGITNLKGPENYGLSLVLGAAEVQLLELTGAYGVFANGGYLANPSLILEITDKKGNLIYQFKPQKKQVIDGKYAFLISSILSDNKTRSEIFGTTLNISRPAAVKTGTAQDFRDAWTIGYTPSLVIGAWVGNNYNQKMDGVAGSLGAAPIWKDLMEKFLVDTPLEQFEPPSGIVKLTTCGLDFSLKAATNSAYTDYFLAETHLPKSCTFTQPVASQSASLSR